MKQAADVGIVFQEYQKNLGLDLPEEVAIAVMSHMFSLDYSQRLHYRYMDIWASEWTGALKDRLPDGAQWEFQEYMTGKKSLVNPAIVHAMRSKSALTEAGRKVFENTKLDRSFVSWEKFAR